MSYRLETSSQQYGSSKYLDHNLKGVNAESDRRLFAQRVSSYGIINFGVFTANQTKQFLPSANGITSDIMLRSLYPFTTDASRGETTFRLLQGTTKIAEWLFTGTDVPFAFPDGAIINSSLTLEVKPKYALSQLMLYWQPVHVLSYIQL